ncbi:hypothetical protein A9Q64_07250 [Yersinia ruckeri]|nr:hypothetical protein A9Q64_07250 [Yersinia ruckeri]
MIFQAAQPPYYSARLDLQQNRNALTKSDGFSLSDEDISPTLNNFTLIFVTTVIKEYVLDLTFGKLNKVFQC